VVSTPVLLHGAMGTEGSSISGGHSAECHGTPTMIPHTSQHDFRHCKNAVSLSHVYITDMKLTPGPVMATCDTGGQLSQFESVHILDVATVFLADSTSASPAASFWSGLTWGCIYMHEHTGHQLLLARHSTHSTIGHNRRTAET
jgi:hypothetical protein